MSPRRFLGLWGPVLLLLGLLFYLSSLRVIPVRKEVWDKALHFVAYGALAVLWVRALHGGLRPLRPRPTIVAVFLTILYGASDELHQFFVPGRDASVLDVLADALGALSAAGVLGFVLSRWSARAVGEDLPEVTLVEKGDCHLCHEARVQLEAVQKEIPFRLVRRHVDELKGDGSSIAREIPVVLLNGKKLFKFRVDPGRLRRALRARPKA